jgi:hypothetical protein
LLKIFRVSLFNDGEIKKADIAGSRRGIRKTTGRQGAQAVQGRAPLRRTSAGQLFFDGGDHDQQNNHRGKNSYIL